jgi:hypothetical protein
MELCFLKGHYNIFLVFDMESLSFSIYRLLYSTNAGMAKYIQF